MLERFREVIDLKEGSIEMKGLTRLYKATSKFLWFTRETGIHASSWSAAYSGRQRIRQDMVMWIARLYPELIYWLVTGVEDVEAGHLSVSTYKARNGQDDASVAYLRALSSDKATPEEKEALRAARAAAICAAHGRTSDGNKEG
jgi:hypothetical protein